MSVKDAADDIASMKVRGALKIAVYAAKALEKEVADGVGYDELVKSADILRDARPSAVSLPNAVNYVLYLARQHQGEDPQVARSVLLADIADYISRLEGSIEKVAEYGANLVEDGDVILTICNSQNVVKIMQKCQTQGKDFKVFACETRPRWQGRLTVKQLSDAGVDATLIVDSAAYHTMVRRDVKKVFVGADTVYSNGDVINKVGTSQVAYLAKHVGCEFIVATESVKFSPYSLHGEIVKIEERDPAEVLDDPRVKVFNPAFDVTTKEYVNMIVTEYGVIPPEAAYHLIKDKFGWTLE